MNNTDRQHPEIDDLLRIVESEGAETADRRVQKHVQSCWKCRAHVDEAQSTLAELARYHDRVLLPNLPEPPRAWADLRSLASQRNDDRRGLETTAVVMCRPVRSRIGKLLLASFGLACLAFALATIVRNDGGNDKQPSTPSTRPDALPRAVTEPPLVSEPIPEKPPTRLLPKRSMTSTPSLPTASMQVRVFGALHEIGADLGEPVEVAVLDSGVRVRGQGLDETRASEIREALTQIPGVEIEFAGDPHVQATDPGARLNLSTGHGPFEQQLRQALGSPGQLEQFASLLLDESDAVLARAYALRKLDEHFPQFRRGVLGSHDRSILDGITADHRRAITEHVSRMNQMLERVRGTLMPPPALSAATDLLAASQRMDRVLGVMFGLAASDAAAPAILQEFAQAWTDLAALAGLQTAAKSRGEAR